MSRVARMTAAMRLLCRPAGRVVVRVVLALAVTGTATAVATELAVGRAEDAFGEIPVASIPEGVLDPVHPDRAANDGSRAAPTVAPDEERPHDPVTYLLVGSDTRATDTADQNPDAFGTTSDASGAADSILVVRVDPDAPDDGAAVFVMSIPRDTWVTSTAGYQAKINATYVHGGIVELVQTIQQEFGIAINHTIEVDFDGVRAVVDAVEGVQLDFVVPMRDLTSSLPPTGPGPVLLGPDDALAYLRSRKADFFVDGGWHRDPRSDLSRAERQQYFLRELARTAIRVGLADGDRFGELVDLVADDLTIDPELDLDEAVRLVQVFRSIDPTDQTRVETATLPVDDLIPAPDGSQALSWRGPDDADTGAFLAILRGDRTVPSDVDPALVPVRIVDLSTDAAAGDAAVGALAQAGFPESSTSSTLGALADPPGLSPPPESTTVIRYAPHRRLEARRVADALGLDDVPLVADDRIPDRLRPVQVLVVLRDTPVDAHRD
jgi:LCP family protein required for cell wall assembly